MFYSWGVDTVSDSVSNLYFPCGIDPCISYHATLILSACLVGAPYDCTTRPVLRILSVFSDISVQGDNICGLLEIWVRDIYTRWLKKDWGIAVRKSYSGQRMVEPFCIILFSLCSCESSIQHKQVNSGKEKHYHSQVFIFQLITPILIFNPSFFHTFFLSTFSSPCFPSYRSSYFEP